MVVEPVDCRKDPSILAQELLGASLIHETREGELVGRIVETEAYYGRGDPPSHAATGKTNRNTVMFGPPGHAYIYTCYGLHNLLNVVSREEGRPGAVLIRALQPVHGIDRMRRNRGVHAERRLMDGPGKLTEALEIDKALNGHRLDKTPLRLKTGDTVPEEEIVSSPRIGIKEPWRRDLRFHEQGNPHVSR